MSESIDIRTLAPEELLDIAKRHSSSYLICQMAQTALRGVIERLPELERESTRPIWDEVAQITEDAKKVNTGL